MMRFCAILLLAVLALTRPSPPAEGAPPTAKRAPACTAPGTPLEQHHTEMVDLLNAYRWSKSLPALRYSKSLELAATLHAIDMAERGYMEHLSPEGETPRDRALKSGFCKRGVGENLYWGKNKVLTPAEAMAGWKASPGHDANMVHEKFRWVGIGKHLVERNGATEVYWVMLLGY